MLNAALSSSLPHKGLRARILILALAPLGLCAMARSAHAAPSDTPSATPGLACASPRTCVDAAAQTYLDNSEASAVQLAIWKDGRFVYSGAVGTTREQGRQAVTPHSLFQIGSNSKKATALAVLRAVEAGRVRLDDSVAKALPHFALAREPGWAQQATVRDLLSHQSGLWDYTPWEDDPDDRALQRTLWGVFADNEWATTPPGAAWNYSNANYSLLGAILERAFGRPYTQVMEREVYARLRLRETHARRAEAVATGRAVWGYGLGRAATAGHDGFDLAELFVDAPELAWVAPADEVDNAFTRPAGLTWSTAEDECRIGVFLLDGQRGFLREQSRRTMLEPEVELTPGEAQVAYSFGLAIGRGLSLGADAWYDVPFWTHDGATTTMASSFLVLPEQHLVLSVLRNANDSTGALGPLLVEALQQYAALPAPRPAPAPSAPDDGARYAGTYSDPQAFGTLVLRWDGKTLSLSAPDLEAFGAEVEPAVIIARKNVLVITVDGQQVELTVWPSTSTSSDAGFLVAREDAFVRVSP